MNKRFDINLVSIWWEIRKYVFNNQILGQFKNLELSGVTRSAFNDDKFNFYIYFAKCYLCFIKKIYDCLFLLSCNSNIDQSLSWRVN